MKTDWWFPEVVGGQRDQGHQKGQTPSHHINESWGHDATGWLQLIALYLPYI